MYYPCCVHVLFTADDETGSSLGWNINATSTTLSNGSGKGASNDGDHHHGRLGHGTEQQLRRAHKHGRLPGHSAGRDDPADRDGDLQLHGRHRTRPEQRHADGQGDRPVQRLRHLLQLDLDDHDRKRPLTLTGGTHAVDTDSPERRHRDTSTLPDERRRDESAGRGWVVAPLLRAAAIRRDVTVLADLGRL